MARSKRDTVPEPETTGHEWDGIYELNKPLPKWWLYIFYATILWSIGYWLLMPSWPLLSSHTKGLLGYSQREKVAEQIEAARAAKSVYREKIAASDLDEIYEDPVVANAARLAGRGRP